MNNPRSLVNLSCHKIYETLTSKQEDQARDYLCSFPTHYLELLKQQPANEDRLWVIFATDQIVEELIKQRNFGKSFQSNNLYISCLKAAIQYCGYLQAREIEIYFRNTPVPSIRSYFSGSIWFRILQRIIRNKEIKNK